jgi:hypothetical protein
MTIPAAYTHAVKQGFIPEQRQAFEATDEAAARAYALEVVPKTLAAGWDHLDYIARVGEVCACCMVANQGQGLALNTRSTKLAADDRRYTEALTIAQFDALRELFFAATGWYVQWLAGTSMLVFQRHTQVDMEHLLMRHDVHLRWGTGQPEPAERTPEDAEYAVMAHLMYTAPEGLAYLRQQLSNWQANQQPGWTDYNAPTALHPQLVAWLGSPTGRHLLGQLTDYHAWQLFCCCGPTIGSPQGMVSWVNQLIAQNPSRIAC